jgi:hypothetical protein
MLEPQDAHIVLSVGNRSSMEAVKLLLALAEVMNRDPGFEAPPGSGAWWDAWARLAMSVQRHFPGSSVTLTSPRRS